MEEIVEDINNMLNDWFSDELTVEETCVLQGIFMGTSWMHIPTQKLYVHTDFISLMGIGRRWNTDAIEDIDIDVVKKVHRIVEKDIIRYEEEG